MIEEMNGDFLQWLRGFYFVAKTGSVRRAAELMHRNPSTISYQLRSLEEELGVILFDRFKKGLRITAEGKNLLSWTVSTFETLQSMRAEVSNLQGELQGQISMAATLPISNFAVNAISEFTRRHPKVHILIERGLAAELSKAVRESEVDFALMPMIKKPEENNFDIVFKARPFLVMRRDHTWPIPAIPDMDDLKSLPFVSFWSRLGGDEYYNYIMATGMGDFIRRNSVIQVNNYHIIMRYVWQGLGVAILDELCFQNTSYGAEWKSLKAIPLDHILPNRLYGIYTRAQKRLSPQAQALVNHLHKELISFTSLDSSDLWKEIRQESAGHKTKTSSKAIAQSKYRKKFRDD